MLQKPTNSCTPATTTATFHFLRSNNTVPAKAIHPLLQLSAASSLTTLESQLSYTPLQLLCLRFLPLTATSTNALLQLQLNQQTTLIHCSSIQHSPCNQHLKTFLSIYLLFSSSHTKSSCNKLRYH